MQLAFSRTETLSVDTIRAIRVSALNAIRVKRGRVTDLRGIKLENGNELCKNPRESELIRLAQKTWLSIYDREIARSSK